MRGLRIRVGLGLAGMFALSSLLAGCGASARASSLLDTEWELEELHGRDVLDDVSVTMRLDQDEKLSGSGGCNRYIGTWETDDVDQLVLRASGTTMMACDQPIQEQERAFLDALAATASFTLGDGLLRLYDAEGTRLAEFNKLRRAQLTNTPWEATAINDGQQGIVNVLEDTTITALFENLEDRLSGNAGCNTYTTTFSRDDGSITIDPPAATMMACEEPVMEQEAWFLQALEQAATYELGHETLYLRAEDGALLVMFREAD